MAARQATSPRFVSETLLFQKCSGVLMTALERASLLAQLCTPIKATETQVPRPRNSEAKI